MSKNKSGFIGETAFFQPIPKAFQIVLISWYKRFSQKSLLFWKCKQANNAGLFLRFYKDIMNFQSSCRVQKEPRVPGYQPIKT